MRKKIHNKRKRIRIKNASSYQNERREIKEQENRE